MPRSHLITVFSLLLLLAGCAGKGPQPGDKPAWIDGNSLKYPQERYLIGRGQSRQRALAQDRARTDLAKIFQVRLREQSRDMVSYQSSGSADRQTGNLERQSERHVQSQTEQVISGIRIAEIWQDPETGQFHALAVLDRLQMSMNLRQAISRQDNATAHEIALAKQQDDLLVKISHASRAILIQQRRARNQAMLKVLDPTGNGIPPRYDLVTLRADRDRLLDRLRISSHVSADPVGGLDTIVAGALANAGFHNSSEAQADYLLDVNLEVEDFKTDDGWYWYRGNLQISLREMKTGSTAGHHRWPVKVSSQNRESARQRLRDAVARLLANELRSAIIGMGLPDE